MMGDKNNNFFEPLHKAHAIEQVIFSIKFASEISDERLKAIKIALPKSPALPHRAPIRILTFQLGRQLPPDATPVAGYVYSRTTDDDTVEEELRTDRSSITFKTSLYRGWAEHWPCVKSYLRTLLPIYTEEAKFKELSLLYIDKFIWNGPLESSDPRALLRPNSPYLVPNIYSMSDLWHSHTGAFLRIDNSTRRLEAVEVEYVDLTKEDQKLRAVVVKSNTTDTINVDGYEPLELDKNAVFEFIDQHMEQLHVLNKQILGSIVVDDMCKRIALRE